MLKDAALLQLDLLLAALEEDVTIKDASAYNVQWIGAAPVFVDVASFEKRTPGQPWIGYRQFCQLFLYPSCSRRIATCAFHPMLRGCLEGIDAQVCWKLLGIRDLAKAGVLTHVYLQAKAQAAYGGTGRDVRADLRAAGFDAALIKANASKLRALIAGLAWNPRQSVWSEYVACGHYKDPDTAQKIEFVRSVAAARDWNLVWDLGCNVGRLLAPGRRARTVRGRDRRRSPRHRPAVSGPEGRASPEYPPTRRRPDRPVSGSWLAKSGAPAPHCTRPARPRYCAWRSSITS